MADVVERNSEADMAENDVSPEVDEEEMDDYLGEMVREVLETRPSITATWGGTVSLRKRRSHSISDGRDLVGALAQSSLGRGRRSLSRGIKVQPSNASLSFVTPIMETEEVDHAAADVSNGDVIRNMVDGGMVPMESAPLSIRFDTHTHTHTLARLSMLIGWFSDTALIIHI